MKTEEEIRKRFNHLDSEINKILQRDKGHVKSDSEYSVIERLACERDTLEWVLVNSLIGGGT